MLLGVDVGGTFTDAVLVADGVVHTAKAPTTPDDQSRGVITAVERALQDAGAQASDVEAFAHGMTVATNALLEGTVARTAFVATDGFTDVVALGRQARRELYRLCAAHPAPLTPPERRFAARERTGPDGVLEALGGLEELVEAVAGGAGRGVASRSSARPWRAPSPRRSPCACCTAIATPTTSARSARPCASASASRYRCRT